MEITYLTSKDKNATNKDFRIIKDFEHLKQYQKDANKYWTYINDKWIGLRNHISPPSVAVLQSSGDCDDFASHMYQVSQDFNPLLLTYFPRNVFKAHTVTVLRPTTGEYKNFFILINWGKINYFTTKQQLINHLEGYAKSKFISYHWAKYDYENGRYRNVKNKDAIINTYEKPSKPLIR